MKRTAWMVALLIVALGAMAGTTNAQQTAGNITGRVTDEQKAALPGVTVSARETATGFSRSAVTDGEGLYRLTAVPIGNYDVKYELASFAVFERKGVIVNVTQTVTVDVVMKLASMAETVTVTGASPLIETTTRRRRRGRDRRASSRCRSTAGSSPTWPRRSRASASGSTPIPTKSTQFSPQINGGNGRNVNYQIDGGDNNDDTVGGLLQLFPLEAIQEFNFVTSRSKAEYGRSHGGVMNIVTKSGTNDIHGSWFTLFRDDALNATDPDGKEQRHRQAGLPPLPVRRLVRRSDHQGQDPLLRRRRADAAGHVPGGLHRGPVPGPRRRLRDAVPGEPADEQGHDEPEPEALPVGALRAQPELAAVRRQPASHRPSNWGDSTNKFNSFNLNHNWVLGGSKLNEFIFQYADFQNYITASSNDPYQTFPNGVTIGQSVNTPQTHRAEEVAVPRRLLLARHRARAASATTSRPA